MRESRKSGLQIVVTGDNPDDCKRHRSPAASAYLVNVCATSSVFELELPERNCHQGRGISMGLCMEPNTRRSLVLRLRNLEDQAAWAEFVDIYEPLVYRLARGKGLQDADAKDVCQDVFRAVAAAIERWDPDPAKGKFRGWLFRIARNHVIDFLTRQARQPRGSGRTSVQEMLEARPANDGLAEAEFAAEFRRRAFHWAAGQVKNEFAESTWQAFWRTGVDNRPVAEVARELSLSPGAVYVARSRVLARLRERVEHLAEESGILPGDGDDGTARSNV
jgi:RNA polymerase sigma factor (sigma-70 family)